MLSMVSCKKDVADSYLIISPETVTSYAGKNWSSISAELQNKKGYKYSELNNGATLAAISLPAKDPNAPTENFTLLFNINQQKRVTVVALNSEDPLDIETSDKLFLYYYDRSVSHLEGVYFTNAIDDYEHQVNMPIEDLLTRIRTLQWDEASLDVRNSSMTIDASINHGYFTFNIYAF